MFKHLTRLATNQVKTKPSLKAVISVSLVLYNSNLCRNILI